MSCPGGPPGRCRTASGRGSGSTSLDTIDGLANTNFSSDSAAASVTTASWAPRMRSAGQADDDAGRRGDQRGEQQRERERDAVADFDSGEAGDAGERRLGQRDLADHAGEHHERQGDEGDRRGW